MVSLEAFRQLALSFPEVSEEPHFDIPSFRVKGKIFATLRPKENRAMLRLPVIEQSVYCDYDGAVFFPVPGTWGAQGATFVELKKAPKGLLREALAIAYNNVGVKKPKK